MSIAAKELMDQLNSAFESEADDKIETTLGFRSVLAACPRFPWVKRMMKQCRETLGAKHVGEFDALLYNVVKELALHIGGCLVRQNTAEKLRIVVNYVLLYFDLIHQDLKSEYTDDNEAYLYFMSDLISFYLDLEIKSSRNGVYSLKKIGQSITTTLYTHLGESEEHLLDAFLKTRLITRSSGELCAPVLCKILTDSNCFIGDEHAYIRFILTFKLLHRITSRNEKAGVIKMAIRKLHPAPELVEIVKKMNHIFPMQEATNQPMTMFLMNADFDFAKAKQEFLKSTTINDGGLYKFYAESECSTVINLLKKNKKNVSIKSPIPIGMPAHFSVEDTYNSFDVDLDPSFYKLRSYKDKQKEKQKGVDMYGENEDQKEKIKNSVMQIEDSANEVECLGIQNKADKRVVVITIDPDEGIREAKKRARDANEGLSLGYIPEPEVRVPAENGDEIKERNEDENLEDDGYNRILMMEQRKDDLGASDGVKVGTSVNKTISAVPESDKCTIEGICKDKSSTKRDGEELTSILQSPGHGVIDSTSNSTGSIFDGKFSKDKTYDYQSSGLWDEGRIEVSSSLDFIGSTVGQINEDCAKTKDPEISSTFLPNDCFAFFSKDDYKSKTSNPGEPVNAIVQGCEYNIVPTLNESGNLTEKTCPKQLCSSIIEAPNYNLETDNADDLEDSELQSTFAKENRLENISDKECDSQENSINFADVNIPEPGFECILNYQDQPPAETLEQESSRGTDFNPKNLAITFENLEHLINAPAKKVNYENVAKSYKIVKSNRLKSSSAKSSTVSTNKIPISDSSMNSPSQNAYRSSPKFIKIDESSVIVNNMKFVTKNLDGQTTQMFQTDSGIPLNEAKLEPTPNISVAIPAGVPLNMNLEGNVQKSIANNGSQTTVTGEPVVKMFKKVVGNIGLPSMERANPEGNISGLSQYVRMQKPDNQTVGQNTLKIYDKTEQTNSKKRKPHAKSVIKTDINMKSILKHINPSSIPQFATETVKDNKRKYPEALQQGEPGKSTQEVKVPRMASTVTEKKKDVNRLLSPCNFLIKPNIAGDPNNFQNCKIGTEERLASHGCLPNEPFMAQSTYYDPNKDNVNASFVSISQADTTVHNVDVEFLVDNVHQFPNAYASDIVNPYNKGLNTLNYMSEPSEMRNEGMQASALGFDGRYLGNLRFTPPVNAGEKLHVSSTPLMTDTGGMNAIDQKSILKYHPGFINAPERFPLINCKGIDVPGSNKFMEKEGIGKDMKSMCKNDGNELNDVVEKSDLAGCARYENHGRASSMEVGLTFSSLRSPPKSEIATPRDVIIGETSHEELKDVDDDMREFVEPWEEPRDYLPNDEEYFKRGLPDPQNLFSEDDLLTHFDKLFPFPNLGRDTLRMEDIDFEAFDKCLCDPREHELNDPLFMNTFNENLTDKNRQKIPESEVGGAEDAKHKEEQHSQRFDVNKESQSIAASESRKNFLGRLRYRRALNVAALRESMHTCTCFRCSYHRKWIRCNMFKKLRAVSVLCKLHEADRLKNEDDELLRKIEESLKTRSVNGKDKLYSNLPLKKRFKRLNAVGNESYYSPRTTPTTYEKFPSYPARPMISIAEVEMSVLKNKNFGFVPKGRREEESVPYFKVPPPPPPKPFNPPRSTAEEESVSHFKAPSPSLKPFNASSNKVEEESVPHFKPSIPSKPFNPLSSKADGSGKSGEAQETAVLAQVNSRAKQQEQLVKAQKSPLSPSETENSQPGKLESFDDTASGRKGEEAAPAPASTKKTRAKPKRTYYPKKRRTRRRKKQFCNVR